MINNLPICCRPAAFKLFRQQIPVLESSDALLMGAIALSMHQLDAIEPGRVDTQLQRYTEMVRQRVRGPQTQALLAHLHEVLFEQEQFAGNTHDYFNPSNSYISHVLQSRRGLPITLSLIYKVIARRLGLRAYGIGLPGHFLAAVQTGSTLLLIDPFYGGREVSVEEAQLRVQQVAGNQTEWSDEMLAPVTNRQWLTRLLQNLLNTFAGSGQYADVAAMLELEMLLWPGEDRLQRDLALVLARCGLSEPARLWLDRYLRNNPDDPQTGDLRQLLEVLAA